MKRKLSITDNPSDSDGEHVFDNDLLEEQTPVEEEEEEDEVDTRTRKMIAGARPPPVLSGFNSYLEVINSVSASGIELKNLTLKDVPITVLAEIRHLTQLLGHTNDSYRASSFVLLETFMVKYPLLAPCVVNNIMFIYAKPKGKLSKMAKMMGCGCVIRSGAAFTNKTILRRVVAEIMILRNRSDKDDVEMFFLVSALQQDSTVADISELVLEGMGEDLSKPIKELKLGWLWLRVVLAQRMTAVGLKLPMWLRDTFLPDRIVQFGLVLMPPSQKVEYFHFAFESLISSMADYHHNRQKRKKASIDKNGVTKLNPVAVLFSEEVAPAISKCFGEKKKKPTLLVAYELLKQVLSSGCKDVAVLESVVHWLCNGGVQNLIPSLRTVVVEKLLSLLSAANPVENLTEDDKSRLAVCALQGAMVMPEVLQQVRPHVQHLTTPAAQRCIDTILLGPWKQLTEIEASVVLRLVSLRQCSGKDHLEWRLQLTDRMVQRAVQYPGAAAVDGGRQEGCGDTDGGDDGSEDRDRSGEDCDSEDNDGVVKENLTKKQKKSNSKEKASIVTNTELFFRFLNHASHDRGTVSEVLVRAHSTAIKELAGGGDDGAPRLDGLFTSEDTKDTWQVLAEKAEELQELTEEEFVYKKIFQILLSQFGLDLLKQQSSFDSEDLVSDVLTCLEQARREKSVGDKAADWLVVLVDVLLALGTRTDSWWRAVLQPSGRLLSGCMTSECAASIMNVLLTDDVLQPEDGEEEEEEGGEGSAGTTRDGESKEEEEETKPNLKKNSLEKQSKKKATENSEEEEGNSDEGDDSDDSEDDEDDGDEEDSDEEEETRLDAMKSALMAAMAPAGGEGMDEDMDAVPQSELRRLDKRLGMVLGQYVKKQRAGGGKKKKKRKKTLKGEGAELLHYRNRALDLVEGIVEGRPTPSVLLQGLMLPLLRALKMHSGPLMRSLTNRIREVLKSIRNLKKYASSAAMLSLEELLDILEEVFSYAYKVPESCDGAVAVLRCSGHLVASTGDESCRSAVLEAYLRHVSDMLRSRKVNKLLIVEPIQLDVPDLRSRLLQTFVEQVVWSSDSSAADAGNASTDSGSPAPANYVVWEVLHEVFGRGYAGATDLSSDEMLSFTKIGTRIQQYLETCEVPVRKDLTPISLALKLLKKSPSCSPCIDWHGLSVALRAFRSRVASKLSGNKHLKRDVDRLATIALLPAQADSAEAKEEKRGLKRKQKEAKAEKRNIKKAKIENSSNTKTAKTATKGKKIKPTMDDLFDSKSAYLDKDDPDSDAGSDDDIDDDAARMTVLKRAEALRKKKASRNRDKKLRAKANKKVRKDLATVKREELAKLRAGSKGTSRNVTDREESKENTAPAPEGVSSLQENISKKEVKLKRNDADKTLSAGLHAGIFSHVRSVDEIE